MFPIIILLWIVGLIIAIVFLVRWWNMTGDIRIIRQQLTFSNPKLAYLVAIGEYEQARKGAIKLIVDKLFPIYVSDNPDKAASMNRFLDSVLPKIKQMGIELPQHLMSGEKFIDYMNGITGFKINYSD